MRAWLLTFLRLIWGLYLALTSIYCLLAFLPYTFFALIKAPAYEWMPWFGHHQAVLYWAALLGIAITEWSDSKQARNSLLLFGLLGVAGAYLTAKPFLATLQNNWAAYWWSLICLTPLVLVAAIGAGRHWPAAKCGDSGGSLPYPGAVLIAFSIALLSSAGAEIHKYSDNKAWGVDWGKLELVGWSLISHVLVAVIIFSVVNLMQIASRRTDHPRTFRLVLTGLSIFAVLWTVLLRFLNSALTFEGWAAHLYAAFMAATLTLFLGWLVLPFLQPTRTTNVGTSRGPVPLIAALSVSGVAVAVPTLIGGGDWNGVLQHTFTIFFWITLSLCICLLLPRRTTYSAVTVVAVLLVSAFTYKALQSTEILWAKPLGETDDEIARTLENYAANDVSFQMAHHILGNRRETPCGDLCRILRQYTNIRDAEAKTDVKLVDTLAPAQGERPNIFILVIDSLRPDYLGAYNPQVDFTPNLDAFAKDSVAVRNVYTQYAGTTLSEPAIWSGVMLLHAHYMQPFSKVNNLEKLAHVDGYQMMVSFDTVLSQILSPSNSLTKLDTDKPLWNRFEACSTLQQTEAALDSRVDKTQPVLFYAQPMNVHQFASNDMPRMTGANWHPRPGFNNRIAYEVHQVDECAGGFIRYLKAQKLYDKSIIIVASDHGDATGEFGRYSHSTSIYPEIIRVPLIVHLPASMRNQVMYDDNHISALTDIAPSLYYLLGHRPIRSHPIFGRPIFVASKEELQHYRRDELFLASDERAVYGLLGDNGKFLYTAYDSPAQSFLFDLSRDPNAQHNLLTGPVKRQYDEQIIDHLHAVADFYGYKPGVGSLLAAAH